MIRGIVASSWEIAGTYHDFHNAWITELRNVLNGGLLPQGYHALGEQRPGDIGPEVLTLHSDTFGDGWQPGPAAGESGSR